jgi:hypothetical protein
MAWLSPSTPAVLAPMRPSTIAGITCPGWLANLGHCALARQGLAHRRVRLVGSFFFDADPKSLLPAD